MIKMGERVADIQVDDILSVVARRGCLEYVRFSRVKVRGWVSFTLIQTKGISCAVRRFTPLSQCNRSAAVKAIDLLATDR